MGNQAMYILAGVLLLAGTVAYNLTEKSGTLSKNSENALARARAREINNGAIESAMRMLADNPSLRTPYTRSTQGGSSTVTFRDTVIAGDSLVVARGTTNYVVGLDTGSVEAAVSVSLRSGGFIPLTVRGAITAFGPIDDLIGDMYIDGREHDLNGRVIPGRGIFAVSTGADAFTNKIGALLGGSYLVGGRKEDHEPTLEVNTDIIETSSQWPNGWPRTPDAALDLPEGTLKSIALSGVDGSRYITSNADWPRYDHKDGNEWRGQGWPFGPTLKGVTYFDVPDGTYWEKVGIGDDSEGLLVFHSSAGDAYWKWISMLNDNREKSFKGLMIFDKLFHIHLNVLGAVIQLNPEAVQEHCGENKDQWVNYCTETIKNATKIRGEAPKGRWRNILAVRSWKEKAETNERGRSRGRRGGGWGRDGDDTNDGGGGH